eukprot:COSAG02_NODE_314_length_24915_cov_18.575596_14_plen_80_part_00
MVAGFASALSKRDPHPAASWGGGVRGSTLRCVSGCRALEAARGPGLAAASLAARSSARVAWLTRGIRPYAPCHARHTRG